MEIRDLAKEALGFFRPKRVNDKVSYSIDAKSPDWIGEMVMDAVIESIPDDFVYQKVFHILEELSNGKCFENILLEPDVYMTEKLNWLFGQDARIALCNNLMTETSFNSLDEVLTAAQAYEAIEIRLGVKSSLESELDVRCSKDCAS